VHPVNDQCRGRMAFLKSNAMLRMLLLVLVNPGAACNGHQDCLIDQYCFSWDRCRYMVDLAGFSAGDHVVVPSLDQQQTCHGFVTHVNFNQTYSVRCNSGIDLPAVPDILLQYENGFEFQCGEVTSAGNCGHLQFCEQSNDSIDFRCPDATDNKSWPMCVDVDPGVCQNANATRHFCDQPYHGLRLSALCCKMCGGADGVFEASTTRGAEQANAAADTETLPNCKHCNDKAKLLEVRNLLGLLLVIGIAIICGMVWIAKSGKYASCWPFRKFGRVRVVHTDGHQIALKEGLTTGEACDDYTEMTTANEWIDPLL